METIKRFFECSLPISICNLKCSYCYVIQENRRKMSVSKLKYSPNHIAKALRKERVGGVCLFNICGIGETLAHPEVIDVVKCLLSEGHFVSITTNGTLTQKFVQLVEECKENIGRLHIAFSFHYSELKKKKWIDIFFENVVFMRNSGASILVQLNLCDEYIPYIDEIKNMCAQKIGAYPQVALTRNEKSSPMSILTDKSIEEYISCGKKFDSKLFEFTVENFMIKRKEFCYAGDWSGTLDLETGVLSKCYSWATAGVNIFDNIDEPITFEAIGNRCPHPYCINSSHFMSLGVIPELKTPTYAELRNRPDANWYSEEMNSFLNTKLSESNNEYSFFKKRKIKKMARKKYSFRGYLSQYKFYQKLHDIKEKFHG